MAKADYFPQHLVDRHGRISKLRSQPAVRRPRRTLGLRGERAATGVRRGTNPEPRQVAEARTEEATLVYQRTVQQAFRDVSDALVAYRKSQEVRSQQQQLTTAAEDATRLSNMRYRGGAASYLEVLDSETRLFAAQLALAQAQLRELQSLVQIYRSLGGGWQQ